MTVSSDLMVNSLAGQHCLHGPTPISLNRWPPTAFTAQRLLVTSTARERVDLSSTRWFHDVHVANQTGWNVLAAAPVEEHGLAKHTTSTSPRLGSVHARQQALQLLWRRRIKHGARAVRRVRRPGLNPWRRFSTSTPNPRWVKIWPMFIRRGTG